MPDGKAPIRSFSLVDSALIVALFSAVCYAMGRAALIGTAQRLGVPVKLMPEVGPEIIILIGSVYLVLLSAMGLLFYFIWVLMEKYAKSLREKLEPAVSRLKSRVMKYPHVYLLFACLAAAAIIYTLPRVAAFSARPARQLGALGGQSVSDVVAIRLKNLDPDLAGKTFRYLWRDAGIVVLKDKTTGELVLIEEDEVRLIILTAPGVEHKPTAPFSRVKGRPLTLPP